MPRQIVLFPRSDSLEVRFWRYTDRRSPNECWPWIGTKVKGYGRFNLGGKLHWATHTSLLLEGRNKDHGQIVLHACDNPCCVNPGHLRWGTYAENVVDRETRGRHPHYAAHRKVPVEEIPLIVASAESQNKLAATYGVTQGAIHYIKKKHRMLAA